MKKVFLLKGLDCPHCAALIEKAVGKMYCVHAAQVNLVQQTLTVDAEDEPALQELVTQLVHSYEPEVDVSEYIPQHLEQPDNEHGHMVLRLVAGAVLFAVGILTGGVPSLVLLLGAYGILGWDVVLQAARNIVKGRIFDEHFLMSVATLGAFAIGEHHEAVAVILFYQVGEFFQTLSVRRSRRSIAELMDIRPDHANVLKNGTPVTVAAEAVAVGDSVLVRPGERIPLDGIVLEGESTLDTSALTGESVPRQVSPGEEVLSGCINQAGVLTIRVTKIFGDSTAAKIIALVENAASRKAPAEQFITRFARWYTPVVVILATLLAVLPPLFLGGWSQWLHRALVFLVVSCPCALVISVPLTFFGGIGAASKHGVLVKGSNYLEALDHVDTVVFDKTGTLTEGKFRVTDILPAQGFTREQVLEYAAQAEQLSTHPIAISVLEAYGKAVAPGESYREIAGHGICAIADGKTILAGSGKLMEAESIAYIPRTEPGTKVYVAADGVYAGCILISDRVKKDSPVAIAELKRMGIAKTVILTGDNASVARQIAAELGIDEYHAQLLPQDKVTVLEQLERQKPAGTKLVFVGDGINDAPVLARADIGIAMGGLGSDAAIEAADVVLMTDEPVKLVEAIRIAKATRAIVVQNIVLALGTKGIILVLGALGLAGMWAAVFADVGVAMLAVLNAMRMLKK